MEVIHAKKCQHFKARQTLMVIVSGRTLDAGPWCVQEM